MANALWVAASDSVYRLNGLNGEAWLPTADLLGPPASSFFRPIFPGSDVAITWKNVRNLAGRTTLDRVRFQVFLNGKATGTRSSPGRIRTVPGNSRQRSPAWPQVITITKYMPMTCMIKRQLSTKDQWTGPPRPRLNRSR